MGGLSRRAVTLKRKIGENVNLTFPVGVAKRRARSLLAEQEMLYGNQRKTRQKQPTWDFVSTELTKVPLLQFQILMQRSAVPPPLAKRLACQGHQATAFTAA